MANEQEVLISRDNLEDYHEELMKQIPKEQIWYGETPPPNNVSSSYVLGVDYSGGSVYYRTATGWKKISGGGSASADKIQSKITISRISKSKLFTSFEDEKCEIGLKWFCYVNNKSVKVNGTIKIFVNGIEKETFDALTGTVTKDVKKHLSQGANEVTFQIKDGYNSQESITFVVNLLNIVVSAPNFSQTSVIFRKDVEKTDNTFGINVSVNGAAEKELHIYMDENEYTDAGTPIFGSGESTQTISISCLDKNDKFLHGSHIIELYATANIDGQTVYSNSIKFNVIFWDGSTEETKKAVISSSFFQTKGKQYEILKIPYFVYKEGWEKTYAIFSKTYEVENENGEIVEKTEYINIIPQERKIASVYEWSVNSEVPGKNTFKIQVGTYKETEGTKPVGGTLKIVEALKEDGTVEKGVFKIQRITLDKDGKEVVTEEGTFTEEDSKSFYMELAEQELPEIEMYKDMLQIDFLAEQVDNNSQDKTLWESKSSTIRVTQSNGEKTNLRANFINFDWTNGGWELVDNRPALKITNGSQLEIPYQIFAQKNIGNTSTQFSTEGVTISVDFSFEDVSEPEMDFLTCFDNGVGFKISPTRALLSNGESSVQVEYANSESKNYNKSMRIDFIFRPIEPRYKAQKNENDPLIVNDRLGAMYIYINGIGAAASEYYESNFANFKNVLFDSLGCSVHLHSFRMFSRNLEPHQILRNWISDMNPASKINAYNRNWIYDGYNAQVLNTEIQSRIPYMIITLPDGLPQYKGDKKTGVKLEFRGTQDGIYDFDIDDVELDVQGTSSQYYPVKNWKFKSTYKVKDANGNETKKVNMFKTSTGESKKYALGDDQIPATVFCLKADYMETSSTHNTVTANLANGMYSVKTPPQEPKSKDGAEPTQEEKDRAAKTRTTIYGRPIVVFYREGNQPLRFGGKYNFNYDKGAEDVFGFFEDEDYEVIDCVEFRENRNDRCLLKMSDYTTKSSITDAAIIERDYDERSWIMDGDNIKGAYEWGAAFEFRYFYHKNNSGQPYNYLKAVTDWVVSTDSSNATDAPFEAGQEPIFERGTANFEYDDNLEILKFLDNHQITGEDGNPKDSPRERRSVDIGAIEPEEFDYKLQTYLKKTTYNIKEVNGQKFLEEASSETKDKEYYVNTEGERIWAEAQKNYNEETYKTEQGENAWNEYVNSYKEENGAEAWEKYVEKYKKDSGEEAWKKVEVNYNKTEEINKRGEEAWNNDKDQFNQEEYIALKGEEIWEKDKDQFDEEEYVTQNGQEAWNKFVEDYKKQKGTEAWEQFVSDYKKEKGTESWEQFVANYKEEKGIESWEQFVADYKEEKGDAAWRELVRSYKNQPWNNLITQWQQEQIAFNANPLNAGQEMRVREYHALYWDEARGGEVYKFSKDSRSYRLAKFKTELPEHFNEHYCLMYFLLMELLGMIDSSTKNMFWATWGERHPNHQIKDVNGEYIDKVVLWYPIFYDMDTMMGVNNTGKMNIPYNIEFDSPLEGSDTGFAYNGHDNVFWNNFREAYLTELGSLFRSKISDRVFSLDSLLKMYEDHSEQFFEALYNEDGKLKIIDSYFKGYQTDKGEEFPDWLHVYQGDRYYYRRYWLPNRFNYLLSKNFAGDYAKDFISMRLNDPRNKEENSGRDITVDYTFDIVTWCDQYTRVKYGGRTISERCKTGETVSISAPETSYNDTETAIYGASNLKSIGSLANKYASTIDLSKASRLLEADLGSSDPNYSNDGLKSISFGSNTMLRKVNIQNCSGMEGVLSLESCPNITEINAKGTEISGIQLPDKGALKTLLLPSTINNLTIKNQPSLQAYENVSGKESGFELPTQSNGKYCLKTLCVIDTPNIDTKIMVEKSIDTLTNLHLEGIDWHLDNDLLLFRIIDKSKQEQNGLHGDTLQDKPILYGTCRVDTMQDYLIPIVNQFFNGDSYPENIEDRRFKLYVTNEITTKVVKFLDSKGNKMDVGITDDRIEHKKKVVLPDDFVEPQKDKIWKEEYQFRGWSVLEEQKDEFTPIEKLYSTSDIVNTKNIFVDTTFIPIYYIKPRLVTFNFWDNYSVENIEGNVKRETKKLVIQNSLCLDDNGNEHMTTFNIKDRTSIIEDDTETDENVALRYKKWTPVNTTNGLQDLVEDAEFNIATAIPLDEHNNPIKDIGHEFDYKIAAPDSDRKYKYTFVDKVTEKNNTNKVHYVGQAIDVPKTLAIDEKVVNNDKTYTFKGWTLITKTKEEIVSDDWEMFDEREGGPITISAIMPENVVPVPDEVPNSSYIYCAVYSSTYTPHTITFKNYNGKIENTKNPTDQVRYSKKPVAPDDPSKPDSNDKQWRYTFAGWQVMNNNGVGEGKIYSSNNLPDVVGDATYIAYYTEEKIKYSVTWKNEYLIDGDHDKPGYKTIYTDEKYWEWGTHPTYSGKTPTKEPSKNGQYSYSFVGWRKEGDSNNTIYTSTLPAINESGDVTYIAAYTPTTREYEVSWYDYNNKLIGDPVITTWGKIPDFNETLYGKRLEKPNSDNGQYEYEFVGWSVQIKEIYEGDQDIYPDDDDDDFPKVEGEISYYPVYRAIVRYHDVEFYDVIEVGKNSGPTLWKTVSTKWDTKPNFDKIPERPSDGGEKLDSPQYKYEFAYWRIDANRDKIVDSNDTTQYRYDKGNFKNINGPLNYIAHYNISRHSYNINWVNSHNSRDNDSKKLTYGSTPTYSKSDPTKAQDIQYQYKFIGWSKTNGIIEDSSENKEYNEVTKVTGDMTYYAAFEKTLRKYTINFIYYEGKDKKEHPYTHDYGTTLSKDNGKVPQAPYAEGCRPGYRLIGWKRSDGQDFPINKGFTETVDGNETYEAYYEAIPYIITFQNYDRVDGYKQLETQTWNHDMGELKYSKGEPTHDSFKETAYAFIGWLDVTDGPLQEGEELNENNDRFYPKNKPLRYVVRNTTFRACYLEGPRISKAYFHYINTGLPPEDDPEKPTRYDITKYREVDWGKKIYAPTAEEEKEWGIEKYGYSFNGWSVERTTSSTEVLEPEPIIWIGEALDNSSDEYHFYVIWSINKYYITFRYIKEHSDKQLYRSEGHWENMWEKEFTYAYPFGYKIIYPTEILEEPETKDYCLTFSHWKRYSTYVDENTSEKKEKYEGDGVEETVVRELVYEAEYTKRKRPYTVYWMAGTQQLKKLENCEYGTPIATVIEQRPPEYRIGYTSASSKVGGVLCAINQIYKEDTELSQITGDTYFYATMCDLQETGELNWDSAGVSVVKENGVEKFYYGGTVDEASGNKFVVQTRSGDGSKERVHRSIILDNTIKKQGVQKITLKCTAVTGAKPAISFIVQAELGFGLLSTTNGFYDSSVSMSSLKTSESEHTLYLDAINTGAGSGGYNSFAEAVFGGKYWFGPYNNTKSSFITTTMTSIRFIVQYHNTTKENGRYEIKYKRNY